LKLNVIALCGVDGSGKSTFANRVETQLATTRPDLRLARLWLRWDPRRGSGSAPASTVSSGHRGHPAKRALAQVGLGPLWAHLAIRSYRDQLGAQYSAAQGYDLVLADRHVVDFYADLVAGGVVTIAQLPRLVTRLAPAPATFVLDADDDELVARLKPGDDPARVIKRAALYRDIAMQLGCETLDARAAGAASHVIDRVAPLLELA
jgi:thymidylate kinase